MKRIVTIALAAIITTTAFAQTTLHLSVEECRAMALESSEDLQIEGYVAEQAKNYKRIALSAAFPKLSASTTYGYLDTKFLLDFPNLELKIPILGQEIDLTPMLPESLDLEISTGLFLAGASLQQPIFAGGRIITGNQMARKGMEMSKESENLTRMKVVAEAEKAYWTYCSVADKVVLLKQFESLLDTLECAVSDMVEVEMATRSDLLKIVTRKSNIQYQMQKARNGLELSRMALCSVIGVDLNTEIVLTDNIEEDPSLSPSSSAHNFPSSYANGRSPHSYTAQLSPNSYTAQLSPNSYTAQLSPNSYTADLSMRPEYRLMKMQVEMKELDIRNVRGEYLPTLGLMAGYSYVGNLEMANSVLKMHRPAGMVMVGLNIPIFNFGEGLRKVQNAKLARNIQQEELNKNSRLLTIEMQHAARSLEDARLLIVTALSALELAEDNLEVTQNSFDVGMATTLDLLDAQTQWQEAYSNSIEARVQYRISRVEYLRVTGQL